MAIDVKNAAPDGKIADTIKRIFFIFPLKLKRALELKPVIDELAAGRPELRLTESEWQKIKEIADVLHHPCHVTQLLQNVNYTMSDFYAVWNQLKLLFSTLAPKVNLAERLLEQMKDKKHDRIVNNPLVLCSVFLDPRFKGLILKSPEQTYVAKLYLAQLWERQSRFEKKKNPDEDVEVEIPSEFNFELLEHFMAQGINADSEAFQDNQPDNVNIMDLLNDFGTQNPEPMGSSVFEYWENHKYKFPQLYQLAKIVHAVPPAQASCERTFSTLAFIFNKYRSLLSGKILEDILIIKLNADLLPEVFEEEIKMKLKNAIDEENM